MVVVPRVPDRVRRVPDGARARDELDDVADELLGEDDDRPPGLVDAGLLAGGAGLGGWSLVGGGEPWALPVGAVLLVLGAALPFRWVWRRAAGARLRQQQAKALAAGLPLASGGAEVGALLAAHERVLAASTSPTVRAGAHAALVEVATALDGRPASDEPSRRFVAERAAAVSALADALDEVPAVQRAQLLEARREAVAVGGFDTLTLLDGLVGEVRSGGHRA